MDKRLDESGQMLVDDLLDMIKRVHRGCESELIRAVVRAGLPDEDRPSWALLGEDGKTPSRRNQLNHRLKRATKVPDWVDVRAIVIASLDGDQVEHEVMARLAELWRRSTGRRLPGRYAGEFERLAGGLKIPRHLKLEDLLLELEQTKAELAKERRARKVAERKVEELTEARSGDLKDLLAVSVTRTRNLRQERDRFVKYTRKLFDEAEDLRFKLDHATSSGLKAAERFRDRGRELDQMFNAERELRDRLAHHAAMNTAFAGAPVPVYGTGIPNLSLPADVVVLTAEPDLGEYDPITRTFVRYLRAFVLYMYGADGAHPDIPRQHFDRIIDGELPQIATLRMLVHDHPVLRNPVSRMQEMAAAEESDIERNVPALISLPPLQPQMDTVNLADGSIDLMEGVEAQRFGMRERHAELTAVDMAALTQLIPIPVQLQRAS